MWRRDDLVPLLELMARDGVTIDLDSDRAWVDAADWIRSLHLWGSRERLHWIDDVATMEDPEVVRRILAELGFTQQVETVPLWPGDPAPHRGAGGRMSPCGRANTVCSPSLWRRS